MNFLLVIFPYRTGNCANFSKGEVILNAQLWNLLWNLQKEKGGQRMRWLESITHAMDMSLSKLWEIVEDRGSWRATVLEVAKSRTKLSN